MNGCYKYPKSRNKIAKSQLAEEDCPLSHPIRIRNEQRLLSKTRGRSYHKAGFFMFKAKHTMGNAQTIMQ